MHNFIVSMALLIGVSLVVMLPWLAVVSLVLGLIGVQPPIKLRSWMPTRWRTLKKLSRLWEIIVAGILMTALPMTLAWSAYEYLRSRYLTHSPMENDLLADVVIFSFVGIVSELRHPHDAK